MDARLLHDSLDLGTPFHLPLAPLGAPGLLRQLAARGDAYHVRMESMAGLLEVEIGNGVVVGARAQRDGALLEGPSAYALVAALENGSAYVEPRRFLSMANVLEPLTAVDPPARIADDTIEIELPMVDEPSRPEEPSAPAPRRRRAQAAPDPRPRGKALPVVALLAAIGLAFVGYRALYHGTHVPEREEPSVAPAPAPALVLAEPVAEPPRVVPAEPAQEARLAALQGRRMLEEGDVVGALTRARRAVALRPGVVTYQVLLGDVLAAHGEPAAARRAYHRASRLRRGSVARRSASS